MFIVKKCDKILKVLDFKEDAFMVKLYKNGAYLLNGTEIVEDGSEQAAILASKLGDKYPSKEEADGK